MADFLTAETLPFFLFFVVPGFVVISIYDVIVPAERRNFGEAFVEVISYSLLVLALSGWTYLLVVNNEAAIAEATHPFVYWTLLVASVLLNLLVVPILVAVGYYALRTSDAFSRFARRVFRVNIPEPSPTPWDFFFKEDRVVLVRFHLKDGGGMFGGLYERGASASSYPKTQQMYVTKLYRLDGNGGFVAEVEDTQGAIINKEDCSMIEFLRVRAEEEPADPQRGDWVD